MQVKFLNFTLVGTPFRFSVLHSLIPFKWYQSHFLHFTHAKMSITNVVIEFWIGCYGCGCLVQVLHLRMHVFGNWKAAHGLAHDMMQAVCLSVQSVQQCTRLGTRHDASRVPICLK